MSNKTALNVDTSAEDKKKYELMVIINPDVGENGAKARLNEIKKMIVADDGQIFFEDVWGLRDMAYRIKKHDRGFYAVLDFVIDPEKIHEMNATLRIEPELIRHMIVNLPFTYEPKSFAVVEEEVRPAPAKKVEEAPSRPRKPAPKIEKESAPAEKAAPAKKEEKEEVKSASLEEVDAKLKSIIDNPDINF
ncbi:30S ribosomal protein S6 [Candidatus Gracilibacteria bacterium]|nr:30S ribosomal protein S6 [Candidatus Gracilibacteria bacterium]